MRAIVIYAKLPLLINIIEKDVIVKLILFKRSIYNQTFEMCRNKGKKEIDMTMSEDLTDV